MLHCRRLAIAALLICASALAATAQVREIRLSHQWAQETDARDRAARVFVGEVEKRARKLKISIHPNSSLGVRPVEQFAALLDGRIEMAIYPLFYASPKVPEFSIGLLPGVPASAQVAKLLKGSEFATQLQALAERQGVHILTWWWLGGGIAGRSQQIGGPETVKGLPVRGGDKAFDLMLSAAGGKTLTMPSTDITKKMGDGTLEAALTSLESLVSFRVFEQSKFATIGGYGIWTSFQPLVISKSAWDGLSDSEQRVFQLAAEISDAYFEASQREAEQAAVDAFAKVGAGVRGLTFEEYAAWLKVAKESSWREYQAISPVARELFNALLQSFIDSGPPK